MRGEGKYLEASSQRLLWSSPPFQESGNANTPVGSKQLLSVSLTDRNEKGIPKWQNVEKYCETRTPGRGF